MKIIEEENDLLVRIFMSEKEKYKNMPLYEYLMLKCKELNISGITILKGIAGYGADKHIHTTKLIDFNEDLPVIIEIIDREENIANLRPYLDEIISKGFITIERVHVIKYREKKL